MVRDRVTSDSGPIEITFADGSVALLDAGADGEALRVKPAAWTDYFAEPLTSENREFIERCGKWTSFDVTNQEPYSRLINELVLEVMPVRTL